MLVVARTMAPGPATPQREQVRQPRILEPGPNAKPFIPDKWPETVVAFKNHCLRYQLLAFDDRDKSSWGHALSLRFSKWRYMWKRLADLAGINYNFLPTAYQRWNAAALRMDEHRAFIANHLGKSRPITLNQYFHYLKGHDPNRQQRQQQQQRQPRRRREAAMITQEDRPPPRQRQRQTDSQTGNLRQRLLGEFGMQKQQHVFYSI